MMWKSNTSMGPRKCGLFLFGRSSCKLILSVVVKLIYNYWHSNDPADMLVLDDRSIRLDARLPWHFRPTRPFALIN